MAPERAAAGGVDLARVVRVSFESHQAFESDYASNLAQGGVFIASDEDFEMRERVKVVLSLPFCDEKLALGGEVVHRVTPEMTAAGGTVGVAIQFDGAIGVVRKMLEPLRQAAGAPEHKQEEQGRRRAPRVGARVAAKLDIGDDEAISAHTRDVSQTGVMVAVPGRGVPVGDRLRVTLTHPTTGENLSVEGVVARDMGTEGGVTGLGIDFAPSDQQREDLTSFVESIQQVEHARRLGGVRGEIAELGIENVLQMFTNSPKPGTLTIHMGPLEGLIGFEGGLVRFVQMGTASGMKALVRILGCREGRFEFHARLDPVEELQAPLPLEAALFEATRLTDELVHLDLDRFSPSAIPRPAAEPEGDLTKLENAVLDLARVGFNIGRIIEVIPEPDPEIYRALASLIDRGVIQL